MNKKNSLIILFSVCFVLTSLNAQNFSNGIKIIAGGRYDDMRMCVGSDAGVKGGPIADIMYLVKVKLNSGQNLAIEIPVMRPILFGAAFQMLQFEPEVSLEMTKKIYNQKSLVFAPGVGVSLHYGPDYRSDLDNRGDDFFAAGPFLSSLIGIQLKGNQEKYKLFGVRFFYAPLFSEDSELSPGSVLGAVAELQIGF